jgi:hypothetical protein
VGLIKLSDDLLVRYDAMAQEYKQPLDTLLERQLARFADFPPTVRVVPLSGETLQRVETLLGGGQIRTAADLLARVKSYAQVTLGNVVIDFSPAQKAELVHRATKRGLPPDQVVKELVALLLDQMFDAVTPYR